METDFNEDKDLEEALLYNKYQQVKNKYNNYIKLILLKYINRILENK